jgi:hypothetical protein
MLFFGYFSCLILGFTALAMLVIGTFTNSTTLPKQHHPRPPIEQTITPEQIAPLHLEVTKEKEASAAKDDVSPVKHHKHKVLARQRNNHAGLCSTRNPVRATTAVFQLVTRLLQPAGPAQPGGLIFRSRAHWIAPAHLINSPY